MHELSIVEDLITLCERHLEANGGSEITEISVKVGRLSGVEPHLLENAFEFYKVQTKCKNAKLRLNLQEIVAVCQNCAQESEIKNNEFLCPKCGSNRLKIIDGEDLYLMQIVME